MELNGNIQCPQIKDSNQRDEKLLSAPVSMKIVREKLKRTSPIAICDMESDINFPLKLSLVKQSILILILILNETSKCKF